jgi:hypothetical protein
MHFLLPICGKFGKNEKKNIVDLHVLGLFRHKKHDLGENKNFRLSRAFAVVIQNLGHAYRLDHKS